MVLMTPGPTPVLEEVRFAMAGRTLHHRTPEFEAIFGKTRELALKLFKTDEILFIASSGSGVMEATITNLCDKKALVINSGKFGERFGKIAMAFGKDVVEIKNEWSVAPTANDIKLALESNSDIDTVCIQICESAGGLRHNVEEIAKVAKEFNPNIMVIADGITAVGVEPIDISNIDALIAGSQKAFMLPPGLAMVGLSAKAVAKIENSGGSGYYFNLKTELKNQRKNTTAWTAPTTLIIGLQKILELFFEEGLDKLYKDTKIRAIATQEAFKAIGLKIYPQTPALSMTTVESEVASDIIKILKTKYKTLPAGGQDHLKGKIFRISHMGLIPLNEAIWAVNVVELALDELNIRKFDGTANRVFLEYFKLHN